MSNYVASKERVRLTQRCLNELHGVSLKADGDAGVLTQIVLRDFQTKHGIRPTGLVDSATWEMVQHHATSRFLTERAVVELAHEFDLNPSIVFAICTVEGRDEGFLTDGRALLQFERHKFHLYVSQRLGAGTAASWTQKHPNICSPTWSGTVYKEAYGEWHRFDEALLLDATCAMLSCCWGAGRIMGFNYALAGYPDVQSFVKAMNQSERLQLKALLTFIDNQPAFMHAVKTRDYERMARMFNGHNYARYSFHTKLRDADEAHASFNKDL